MVLMQILTFSVYIGSAIYTPSIPGIMEEFHVSYTKATLGLSLYVLAYGIGVSEPLISNGRCSCIVLHCISDLHLTTEFLSLLSQ